jgi:hypothetical protein
MNLKNFIMRTGGVGFRLMGNIILRHKMCERRGTLTVLRKCRAVGICLGFLSIAAVVSISLAFPPTGISYYDPNVDANASPDALRIARQVGLALCNGTCEVALRRNPTVGTVQTFIAPNGTAKVVYNPQFLKSVDTAIGDGAVFGILACEVGHVVDGRMKPAWMPRSWAPELRADAWAGCAVARAALPKDKAMAAVRAILENPSPAHSARNERGPALELGYQSCGGVGNLPRKDADQNAP